jgi:hypothetical protein
MDKILCKNYVLTITWQYIHILSFCGTKKPKKLLTYVMPLFVTYYVLFCVSEEKNLTNFCLKILTGSHHSQPKFLIINCSNYKLHAWRVSRLPGRSTWTRWCRSWPRRRRPGTILEGNRVQGVIICIVPFMTGTGWPDVFPKKITQSVAQHILKSKFYGHLLPWKKNLVASVILKKTVYISQSPNSRKFTRFDHPCQGYIWLLSIRLICSRWDATSSRLSLTSLRNKNQYM